MKVFFFLLFSQSVFFYTDTFCCLFHLIFYVCFSRTQERSLQIWKESERASLFICCQFFHFLHLLLACEKNPKKMKILHKICSHVILHRFIVQYIIYIIFIYLNGNLKLYIKMREKERFLKMWQNWKFFDFFFLRKYTSLF